MSTLTSDSPPAVALPSSQSPIPATTDTDHRALIALFGGSFDPPHLAHQQIAVYLLQEQLVDQVWFVPVKHHPFGKIVSSDRARVEMLELIVAAQLTVTPELAGRLRVEEYELHQARTSYTIQTLRQLAAHHPAYRFVWVIGSDNVANFPQWQQHQEILTEFGVLVYPRAGSILAAPSQLPAGMQYLAAAPQVTTSSTQIRAALAAGQSVTAWVAPVMAQYLNTHHLYQTPRPPSGAVSLSPPRRPE